MIHKKNAEEDIDHLEHYAYSTVDQKIEFEGKQYTIKKDDLYHLLTCRKFHIKYIEKYVKKHDLKIVEKLTTSKKRVNMFIL